MKVAIRTDASLAIGTGHVMRCLALAEALRHQGAEVSFISRELPGNMITHLKGKEFLVKRLPAPDGTASEGPPVHAFWAGVNWQRDAAETATALEEYTPDWLIVDHYSFDKRWETAVRRGQMQLMVLDDLADRPHDCDLLLDQNLGREPGDYHALVPEHCKLLIDPQYALLRPEFAAKRTESLIRRVDGELEHILVAMGGIDQNNTTALVMEAIYNLQLPVNCQLTVILGENAPWFDQVNALASSAMVPTTVLRGVRNMATLMSTMDLAIGGAGLSTWERCAVGLPSILITMAQNQISNARAMADRKAAVYAESVGEGMAECFLMKAPEVFRPEELKRLSRRSAGLCDGDGAARVLAELVHSEDSFRDASLEDSRRIWEWRQYPGHARFNRNSAAPDFFEHHEWFANALSDPDRRFRILQLGILPCGYLRLDRMPERRGTISICLSEDARGRKLSRTLLQEADRIAIEIGLDTIDAEVHAENQSSIRAFESAGYARAVDSPPFIRYQRDLRPTA